jgi:hypothetical protein
MHRRIENDLDAGLRGRIGGLQKLEPPPHCREQVLRAMSRESEAEQVPRRGSLATAAAFALVSGTAIAIVAMLLAGDPIGPPDAEPTSAVAAPDSASNIELVALLGESMRLERMLGSLPAQRQIIRADTADTIAVLETQIAVLDEQLTFGAAAGLRPETRATLWRDRVDVMNALVQVRYAQSNVFEF